MSFYEDEIAKLDRRIKKIREHTDPTKMRTNLRRYELERKKNVSLLDAWQHGKPFAEGIFMAPLFRAMGFEYSDLLRTADRTPMTSQYLDTIREVGLPDDACDRTVVCVAMVLKGHLPAPDLLVACKMACEPAMNAFNTIGWMFNKPVYHIDIPLEANEENLKYVTDQLYEFVSWAEERFPGKAKFDEDKLHEIQEADRIAYGYYREMGELRKAVPSPISGQDVFRLPRLPDEMADLYEHLEFMKEWVGEVRERAAKGIGSVKEEKLRAMWTVSGPYYLNPWSLLHKRGVSVPWFHFGMATRNYGLNYEVFGGEKEYGRKLTPMEEQARMLLRNTWAGLGSRWVGNILLACRELKIDAIFNFEQVGCVATAGLAKLVADAAEREYGIPTMHIEGRDLDSTSINKVELADKMNDFVDMCFQRKGIPITGERPGLD